MKEWFKEQIKNALKSIWSFTYYTGNSADGTKDSVAADKTDGNAPSYSARRLQHFGFRSLPPSGVSAIRLGNWQAASNSVIIAEDSTRFGPGDLADGEVAIYCKIDGAVFKLDGVGAVTLDSATGQLVTIQGGTDGAARLNDTTKAGALMAAWMGQVEGFINGLVPLSVAPLSSTFATAPGIGVINSASTKTKIG